MVACGRCAELPMRRNSGRFELESPKDPKTALDKYRRRLYIFSSKQRLSTRLETERSHSKQRLLNTGCCLCLSCINCGRSRSKNRYQVPGTRWYGTSRYCTCAATNMRVLPTNREILNLNSSSNYACSHINGRY